MTDELALTVIIAVAAVISIVAGIAWWINRPQRERQINAPRIQPLFAGEAVGAVAGGVDEPEDELPASGDATRDRVAAAPLPPDALRGFARAEPAPEAEDADAATHLAAAEPAFSSWETAAARAQRNAQQAAMSDRAGAGAPDASRGVGSPSAWAGGGLRHESSQPQLRRAPMQPHLDRPADRHLERPAERHVERYADRQPERFAHGVGGARPTRVGDWAAAGSVAPPRAAPSAAGGWNDGQSVRFSVPTDGTLQFLPGRLEIMAGQEAGREIRFVRLPNTEPEITFGRNEGAPYRHVQLRDGTVSRLHARLRLQQGCWTLTNLSTTNPVTYNGRILGDGEEQPLEQDDRIEMGEVAFRFRSR